MRFMQCDYYSATIKDSKSNVLGFLQEKIGGDIVPMKFGRQGYKSGFQLVGGENVLATIYADGNNDANPHAFASSDNAILFRDTCREIWTNTHEVTRIDVCEDFNEAGVFETMKDVLVEIGERKNMAIDTVGDWIRKDAKRGRTLYLGSKNSAVRLRLYEKGKKHANELYESKGFGVPEGFPIHWTRLEAQVRPVKHQRVLAATGSLESVWGYAQWLQEAAAKLLDCDVPRVKADMFRNTDAEKTWLWIAKQYGNFFDAEAEKLGGYQNIGAKLEEIIQQARRMKLISQKTLGRQAAHRQKYYGDND